MPAGRAGGRAFGWLMSTWQLAVPQVHPRLVYPTYFSDRAPYMNDCEWAGQAPGAALHPPLLTTCCWLGARRATWQPAWRGRLLLPGAPTRLPTVYPASPWASLAAGLSRKIVDGLRKIKMIDRKGNVLEDPR